MAKPKVVIETPKPQPPPPPKLKAAPGRVIVKPDPIADTSEGGIILPNQAKQVAFRGTVVDHEQGEFMLLKLDDATQFVPGERVYFGQYAGVAIPFLGTTYLNLPEEEILAVVEGKIDDVIAVKEGAK